jgi:L-methionine (R)-S-oxide reductase
MRVDYGELTTRLVALCVGEADTVALMASVACEVFHADARFDWVGFYRNVGDQTLKIGPYQGGHGCLTIPFDKGVCGAAARTRQTQIVPDVEAFAGHIACASSTRSEIVVPVFNAAGELLSVFDIDSDRPDAFDGDDQAGIEGLMLAVFGDL